MLKNIFHQTYQKPVLVVKRISWHVLCWIHRTEGNSALCWVVGLVFWYLTNLGQKFKKFHWLDLLITKSSCDHVKSVFPADGISDHFSVVSEINLSAPVRPRKTITFRKTTNICMISFRADFLDSSLTKNPKNDLHDLCDQYTSVLISLLDKHAPLQTKKSC